MLNAFTGTKNNLYLTNALTRDSVEYTIVIDGWDVTVEIMIGAQVYLNDLVIAVFM